jgi:glucose/arabinose dehydrogenase
MLRRSGVRGRGCTGGRRRVSPRLALGLLLALTLAGGLLSVPSKASGALPAGFSETVTFSGLTQPTALRFSPDGRVFVAEKSGLIKVFDGLTDQTPTVFANLSTKVHNFWDRGLLGLALDPGFPTNPYVYALYTHDAAIGGTAPRWGTPGVLSDPCPNPPGATASGCVVSGRVSRLQAAGNVMTGTEQVLVEGWCQQYPSHSIGTLAFGADGALYVSGGEGASFVQADYGQLGTPSNPCSDPAAEGGALRSQDIRTNADPAGLNGAVLRIDPSTGAALPDNPLAFNSDANARRIIAHGFRNPFRFAVKPGTSELWVGDVGWDGAEEIDIVQSTSLGNFGWPCYEGTGRQSTYDALDLGLCESLYGIANAVRQPFFAYPHDAPAFAGDTCSPGGGSSLSGLAFYQGGSYPTRYNGALFFADYSRKCIWALIGGSAADPEPFAVGAAGPVDLQVGPGGDLFYADLDGGNIVRIGFAVPQPPPDGTTFVSDMSWVSSSNGYGPVERDRSNGESAAGDGRVLTLAGVTFAKGLGVHALSEVVVSLGGSCSRFRATVGVDDEVGALGSVVFQVFADGVKLFESGVLSGSSASLPVDVDVSGRSSLRLLVGDGGGGDIDHDHADWAEARLVCGAVADTTAPTVVSVAPLAGASGVAASVRPSVTFSEAMSAGSVSASTFGLRKQGASADVSASVAYDAGSRTATLTPAAALEAGASYTARVVGGASGVKDVAGNALAADHTWTFTIAATSIRVFPSSVVRQTGTAGGGTVQSLAADDNNYYLVNSTTIGTRTTDWYGVLASVPNSLQSLAVTYKGANSRTCTQTVSIWRWTTSTWVVLATRSVGTTEVQHSALVPTGALADYISGTSGNGDVRLRIRCTTTLSFTSRGELLFADYRR